ncbi:uncharacterized protein LOC110977621 [Acanthaster planci]|uniref:Uncharacterized protein LOC110977621 n=1 Tax=Acanthaster planci TaxID=133434 RepID=A0A8B7Y343_ACAPL|nr:uncharacterized protein LOC110977621 [Acanthaster planci]
MAFRKKTNTELDELPKEAQECLMEKMLCTLVAMGQNRPKFRTTLQNALGPCTALAPYVNPLDALVEANEASTGPAVSVIVPHAKRRVYTVLETVKKASKARLESKKSEGRKYELAPQQSDVEKEIMNSAIEWLRSCPEGTEDSLVDELIQRLEKKVDSSRLVLEKLQKANYVTVDEHGGIVYHFLQAGSSAQKAGLSSHLSNAQTRVLSLLLSCPPRSRPSTIAEFLAVVQPICEVWLTVSPARFFGVNLRQIKHREIKDETKNESAVVTVKMRKLAKQKVKLGKEAVRSEPHDSKSEGESKVQVKTEFSIGVFPGENDAQDLIPVTPNGITGIEVSASSQAAPPKRPKELSGKRADDPERMRAVGQTKGLSECFTNRLTVAVRSQNAVLVPAGNEERKNIIGKVTEWLCSIRSSKSTGQSAPQTVPKLQRELSNMCVGKVRRLDPSTINAMLQDSGNISIDGDHKVTYHLPSDREGIKKSSWQQQTIQAAVKSCNFSSQLKKAFPRKQNKKGTKSSNTGTKNQNVKPQRSQASTALYQADEYFEEEYFGIDCDGFYDDYGDTEYDDFGYDDYDDYL